MARDLYRTQTQARGLASPALLSGVLFIVLSSPVFAIAVPPCTEAPPVVNIFPLTNPTAVYCVSDYGWSDTWFVGTAPPVYDPLFDVLSGDDSPNLRFGILGGPEVATGFGWISPVMDRGFLAPSFATGSPWEVVTPVHPIGIGVVQSEVHHPLGMNLVITTTLSLSGQITQNFRFINTGASTFTAIRFADYFNFHPNGSTGTDSAKGSISYDPLTGLIVTGPHDGTFIADGTMRGERVADANGCSDPQTTWDMVQTNTYPSPCPISPLSMGPGDLAGGLAWDLAPTLAPTGEVSFTIFKLAEPLGTPEPSTLILLVGAIAFLAARRSA